MVHYIKKKTIILLYSYSSSKLCKWLLFKNESTKSLCRAENERSTYRHSYLLSKLPISSKDSDEAVDLHTVSTIYLNIVLGIDDALFYNAITIMYTNVDISVWCKYI